MLWFPSASRGRPALTLATLSALLGSPGQASADPPTPAPAQAPVETYIGPRPKYFHVPSCEGGSRAGNRDACQVLDSGIGGWADVNFMVDPNGKPFEITITRSTGNKALDDMARKAVEQSAFVPGSLNGKPIESGFEVRYKVWNASGSYAGARREFIAAYKSLVKAVDAGDRPTADTAMKQLNVMSLYEDAFLGMATYLYATKWGDDAQQLNGLLRASAEENHTPFLPSDMFKAALQLTIQLQLKMRLYAEALTTYERLQKAGIDKDTAARFKAAMDQVEKIRSDGSAYEVPGAMPEGSWHVHLFKRHFQAEVAEGYISQVKLRCEKHYVFFAFDPKLQYQVDSKDGNCSMELIGAPGTRFKLMQF